MTYETILILFAFLGGLYLLIKGSELLIDQATFIAHSLKISPLIIGIVIISFGTSLPELAVSLVISFQQQSSNLIVANILGSNIANVLLVLGTAACLGSVHLTPNILKKHLVVGLLALCLFSIAYYSTRPYTITQLEGFGLLIVMLIYLYFIYRSQKPNSSEPLETPEPPESTVQPQPVSPPASANSKVSTPSSQKIIFLSLLSIGMIGLGGELVSRNSVFIATEIFHANEIFAGVILLALGTSLPELVLSIIAFRRGKNEILIGNILGSNIFNLLFIIGIGAFIHPLSSLVDYTREIITHGLSIMAIFIFSFTGKAYTLSRIHGIAFLLAYGIYLYYFLAATLGFEAIFLNF